MPDQPAPKPALPRTCEGCGQRIPSTSKLAATEDGRLLCLACQIRAAQLRGLRH